MTCTVTATKPTGQKTTVKVTRNVARTPAETILTQAVQVAGHMMQTGIYGGLITIVTEDGGLVAGVDCTTKKLHRF